MTIDKVVSALKSGPLSTDEIVEVVGLPRLDTISYIHRAETLGLIHFNIIAIKDEKNAIHRIQIWRKKK